MLDVCIPAINGAIAAALDGTVIPRLGNRHPSACPSNTYAAANGQILIYCLTEDHWRRLARLMGRPDLLEDERYRDHNSRYRIIDEVDGIVGAWVAERRRDDLVESLIGHGVPCAPVRTISEVANDPELERRGLVRRGEFAGERDVKVLGSAVKLSGLRGDETSARVSSLGEDAAEVLGKIGIGADELERLRRDGVI